MTTTRVGHLLLLSACLLSACLVAAPLRTAVPPAAPPAQVIVLSTLHQLHEDVPGYSMQVLSATIERLAPDVLCLEVTPAKLAARAPERNKREYPEAIYPLLERHDWRVYALEPAEPRFSALLQPYLAASKAFADTRPAQAEAFATYGSGIYAGLRAYWTTPARVNDRVTDATLRAKHALQQALVGSGESTGWQGWNEHFLGVIDTAAAENPGKRIVVTVGAEHAYWLREHLEQRAGITLLETATLLADGDSPIQE
jgi:hypothetical protein